VVDVGTDGDVIGGVGVVCVGGSGVTGGATPVGVASAVVRGSVGVTLEWRSVLRGVVRGGVPVVGCGGSGANGNPEDVLLVGPGDDEVSGLMICGSAMFL
jgi:hypothetical protein